ncbi:hypothetical protein [Bartonella massiliensis]|uniref:hypothetical protein n=1 Tax=Bartonella massiliensis TaxID=929795 RepID=UPI00115C1333|nr:hypothetical protein [Bartonella massiliensis]
MIEYLAFLGLIIIAILMLMVMIRLPYLLVKHMRLSFKLAQELKKSTTQQKHAIQQLRNDPEEIKRQNLVRETLDAKIRLLNFKESLPLYPKECKIILCIFILISLLQFTFFIAKLVWWKYHVISVIMPLSRMSIIYSLIWVGIFLIFPIIAIMGIKLTQKLRAMLQQLDEAIEQRDQAIRMKNVQNQKEQGETK